MKNYFEIFEIPAQFEIDLDDLEQKYLLFQAKFHPDIANVNDLSKSIEINQAYKNLSDDFLRACYLVKLQGVNILEDEKAVKLSHEMLEYILELQEEISENLDENKKKTLKNRLNLEIKALFVEFLENFKAKKIEDSAHILVKIKYLKKSLSDLKKR